MSSQVIEDFAANCRQYLKDGPSDAALDKVVADLQGVLANNEVYKTYFPPENTTERQVI